MKKLLFIATGVILLTCQFCKKGETTIPNDQEELEPVLPGTAFSYVVTYPAHIQTALTANDNTPADNAITNDGATLGRVLFYDKQLSIDNSISCGSCHKQEFAFDDTLALSKGVNGGVTTRNSMALLNMRFYKSGKMFWDERAATVEKQALQPIQNHAEMGLTLTELETKVKALSYYPALFQKAFGSSLIDSIRIAKALAQFERSIVTYQSKYDMVKQGLATFTAAEAQGEQIFLNAAPANANTCASCHTPPMFLTSSPIAPFTLRDANDRGINNQDRFKSGTLRNISNRLKLFHNGSVASLQAMFTAGSPGSTIQPIPQHTIAAQDVQSMTAFLNTLTDNTIATEEKFSDPFK